jgi:hypothetical protein
MPSIDRNLESLEDLYTASGRKKTGPSRWEFDSDEAHLEAHQGREQNIGRY